MTHLIPGTAVLAGLLCTLPASQPTASFTSLHVFGDGVCTTTDNTAGPAAYYHGRRYCNGRVWVEVLAQWQGLAYDPAKNQSYFGHYSADLLARVTALTPPPDVATALFTLWAANADFVLFSNTYPPPYSAASIPAWNNAINQSVANNTEAASRLYQKGARTLVLPTAADITATPFYFYMNAADKQFIRQRVIDFNIRFRTAVASLAATRPGLTIHQPDAFAFFDQVLANPAAYGLVSPPGGDSAVYHLNPTNPNLNGPEANYVFWDDWHPSAKFQMHLADLIQRMVSPPRLEATAATAAEVTLELAQIPLGRQGVLNAADHPAGPWQPAATILEPSPAGNRTKTLTIPPAGPRRFYQLRFPIVWTWP